MSTKNSETLVMSPLEVYEENLDEDMEDFVLRAVNDLLIKNRRKHPEDNITLDRSEIKGAIKRAAKQRGKNYNKRWLKLLPLHLAAAGWNVEITNWGYSLTPLNVRHDGSHNYYGDEEE